MSETTTTPEATPIEKSLDELRIDRKNAYAAVINSPVYTGRTRSKELEDAYFAVESAYLDAEIAALEDQINDIVADDTLSDAEMGQQIHDLINQRADLNRQEEREAMLTYGSKLNRIKNQYLQWYANASKAKRIAAGVGLGALGSAVATVGGSVAGFAAGAAAGGVAMWRFARGYTAKRADLYKHDEQVPQFSLESSSSTTAGEILADIREFFHQQSVERIEAAKENKRTALKHGVGSLALGAVAGVAVKELTETDILKESGEKIMSGLAYIKNAMLDEDSFFSRSLTRMNMNLLASPDEASAASVDVEQSAEIRRQPGLIGESEPQEQSDDPNAEGGNSRDESRGGSVGDDSEELETNPELDALSEEFIVEEGNGYTHELRDALKTVYGIELSGQGYWDVHKELVNEIGPDYINMIDYSGDDTYKMGPKKYDIGLNIYGRAEWDPRAVVFLDEKFGDGSLGGEASAEATSNVADQAADHGPTGTDAASSAAVADRNFGSIHAESDFNTTTGVDRNYASIPYEAVASPEITPEPNNAESQGQDNIPIESLRSDGYEAGAGEPDAEVDEANADTLQGLEALEEDLRSGAEAIPWESLRTDAQIMLADLKTNNISSLNQNMDVQKTLMYLQHDLSGLTYEGTDVAVIEERSTSLGPRWEFNDLPEGVSQVPHEVITLFEKYVAVFMAKSA